MGIQGLLPLLKSIMVQTHIKDLHGCCVAVDTYSWLHKGALSCSTQLCKGQPTSRHIDYCMHRVNLLRHYGVKPILVFDGGFLPMKTDQENKRARARKENLARAMELESNGNSAAAFEFYQKAVDISPSIAYELIQVLKQESVCYIVAPYEADAQMTFLALSKQVDAVITEDSDLIPFGCPRIIYKMDKFGQGVEFRYSMLQHNKELNFNGFTKQMLLEMCILSGCDYLQSLPGMGLKKAHVLMKKFKSYDKVMKHLKYNCVAVSSLYEESFKKAILTFQHQRVYNPIIEDIIHLSDISDVIGEDLDFLGPSIPQHIAKGIARGDLDPFTKMPFQIECVSAGLVLDGTYKLKTSKPEGERKKLDLPVQKNLLTNYFCFASLEAKRKFRAPRITPKHPNPRNEASSPRDEYDKVANISKMNCSLASLPASGNLGMILPEKDSLNDGLGTKPYEFLESSSHEPHDKRDILGHTRSQQNALLKESGYSIHKPCTAFHKDHASCPGGKMRTKNNNVVVRSSYFQNIHSKEDDQDRKNETLVVKDDAASDTCASTVSESEFKVASSAVEGKTKTENGIIIVSSCFEHKSMMDYYDDTNMENLLVKDVATIDASESTSVSDTGEERTSTENRKVNVSSYFQHKSLKENDRDSKYEELFIKDCVSTDICEDSIPDPASSGNDFFQGTVTKRKGAPSDLQTENENNKYVRGNAFLSIPSNQMPTIDNTAVDMKDEKFGSNISHLDRYADIAEKSIERFVSVISSFRCTSSGSRASGLRAPLKDVRNTCISRPTVEVDLSKFAYLPTNKEASSASRRV